MRSLLDVNVLIALFQPNHTQHQNAHEWWAAKRTDGWASCPLTQNGFVRIVSQSKYRDALTIVEAMRRLQIFIDQTEHTFWPDDISFLDPQRFNRAGILGPKQLTDIYLVALAVKNGGRLATFDRAIPRPKTAGQPRAYPALRATRGGQTEWTLGPAQRHSQQRRSLSVEFN